MPTRGRPERIQIGVQATRTRRVAHQPARQRLRQYFAMIQISPSILSADFTRLGEETATVERPGASLLHVVVMDGRFVPNITVGLPVVKAISRATRLPIDAHLMIVEPDRYAEQFVKAGARMVSIHIEADPNAHRTLSGIRGAGGLAGIVINPGTSLSALDEAIK